MVGRRILSDLAAVLCVVLVSRAAVAETISPSCPEKPEDAASARALAKTWFNKGEALVKEEMYAEALGAFNCSLRMVEHPATAVNAAKAAELAGDKAEALALYERATAATSDAERRTEIDDRITALRAEIAEEEAARQPAPEPAPEPEPTPEPPPSTSSTESTPSTSPDPEGSPLVVPGYVVLGLGGAGVVVGAVLAGLAAKSKSDGEDTHDYATFRDDQDALAGRQAGAIVSFAVGGALLVTGAVLVIAGKKRQGSRGEAAVAVEAHPTGNGFAWGGTF